ncbi:carboxypeptidase-like regulatory domain-containing protein [Nonlabens sp. Asnod3-H03]|uniref:carboxypeptidase-like regulatory domain-containing protein n=1 Tax=Nonlabens sp. Asnod3-H03 TaxID=3160580 RepID=UPI003864E19E
MKIIFLALFFSGISFGQQIITGKVIDLTGEPILGATVLEKGTDNYTETNFDGEFSLTTKRPNTTIVISYAGYEAIEINVDIKKTNQGVIKLQGYGCNLPIRPQFTIFSDYGVLNNPYGINLDFWNNLNQLKNTTRINANLTYQTNLDSDYYFRASAQLYEIQSYSNFSMSIDGSFEKINFQESFKPTIYSVKGIFKTTDNLGVIAGGKLMRLNTTSFLAPTIGLTYDEYLWTGFSTSTTVSFFNGNTQYVGRIAKDFGRIATFINYYKLHQFDELSIGLGYKFYY